MSKVAVTADLSIISITTKGSKSFHQATDHYCLSMFFVFLNFRLGQALLSVFISDRLKFYQN